MSTGEANFNLKAQHKPVRSAMFIVIIAAGLIITAAFGQKRAASQIDWFVIGRYTFFDFGPPDHFYEIFLVRQTPGGASIEKLRLTPPGDPCLQPAEVETATALLNESVAELLGRDPCRIPEKDLHREQKRCKNCRPAFSGARVSMQVTCGSQIRVIQSTVLDRDMFGPAPNTPQNTSWTMQLLDRLDEAIGKPGVMDRKVFYVPNQEEAQSPSSAPTLEVERELADGRFDALFKDAPEKISQLYKTVGPLPPPGLTLLSSTPYGPEKFIAPLYPAIARLAHTEGQVSFRLKVDDDGNPRDFAIISGHVLLRRAVQDAVSKWRFPKEAANQQIEATIEFKLNCPDRSAIRPPSGPM